MNIPWSDLKKYSENKFGSHLKHRLQLVHYIESISANKIIYWMEKYDLDYFCHFDAAEQINDFLGPGIYLYVNSVTDVMYVGCSDEMRKQLQRPDEYKMDECIITINTRKFENAKKMEIKLINALRPQRNKVRAAHAQKESRQKRVPKRNSRARYVSFLQE